MKGKLDSSPFKTWIACGRILMAVPMLLFGKLGHHREKMASLPDCCLTDCHHISVGWVLQGEIT